jgi:hypothetical protein
MAVRCDGLRSLWVSVTTSFAPCTSETNHNGEARHSLEARSGSCRCRGAMKGVPPENIPTVL